MKKNVFIINLGKDVNHEDKAFYLYQKIQFHKSVLASLEDEKNKLFSIKEKLMSDEILLKQTIEEQIKHNDEYKNSDSIGIFINISNKTDYPGDGARN